MALVEKYRRFQKALGFLRIISNIHVSSEMDQGHILMTLNDTALSIPYRSGLYEENILKKICHVKFSVKSQQLRNKQTKDTRGCSNRTRITFVKFSAAMRPTPTKRKDIDYYQYTKVLSRQSLCLGYLSAGVLSLMTERRATRWRRRTQFSTLSFGALPVRNNQQVNTKDGR